MTGPERRTAIINQIKTSSAPVPGKALAAQYEVSRQVIVQDIAVLRAEGAPIVSTNRGYILASKRLAARVFKVYHSEKELAEELEIIVNGGGTVKNVFVNHRVYGRIEAELNISNRVQAAEFVRSIEGGKSRPLMVVTEGYHYHTVTAAREELLDGIEYALKARGFLLDK